MIRSAVLSLILLALSATSAQAYSGVPSIGGMAPGPDQSATCTDTVGPGMAPPAIVTLGAPGFHAAWYGQSGYPVLCPGHTARATVAFINSGSLGWYAGKQGSVAYLGTSGPEPGPDKPSLLGVDAGWPAPNRIAAQPSEYIGPGQVAWFQFTVRAPSERGVYRLGLRPVIEGAQWLEDSGVYWSVTVKQSDADVAAPPVMTTPVAPVTTTPVAPVATVTPAPERDYFPLVSSDGSKSFHVNALMYHYVSWLPPDPDALRVDLTVSPRDLEDQVKYLQANGYHTITAVDMWWALDTGSPLPSKPVMLTFDDGYVDHHDVVLPLLRAYGMVGTFAVTANLIDKPGYMTKAMVRDLADAGMDVESHAVDHYSVNRLSYADQVYQLCTSRRILSAWTGKDVRHFIFPSGDHLPVPSAALTACGYLSAYRKDGGSVESSNEMFALRRVRVRGQAGLAALLFALEQ